MSKSRIIGVCLIIGAFLVGAVLQYRWGLLFETPILHPPETIQEADGLVVTIGFAQWELHWPLIVLVLIAISGVVFLLRRPEKQAHG